MRKMCTKSSHNQFGLSEGKNTSPCADDNPPLVQVGDGIAASVCGVVETSILGNKGSARAT